MKIEVDPLVETTYDEIMNADLKLGDIILIKQDNIWFAQFVVLLTIDAIYLHTNSNKVDGGGMIFWPKAIIKQKLDKHRLYGNLRFIHIPVEREQNDHTT